VCNRILKYSFCFLIILASCFWLIYPIHLNGAFITFTNFRCIAPNIYVSPDTPDSIQVKLIESIRSARVRSIEMWGSLKSNSKVIYCHDSIVENKYNPTKSKSGFVISPFFHHIVIGPSGLDSNAIGHEMCHAELFERLPFPKWVYSQYVVPTWFDEGLAMQMNLEHRYSKEMWDKYSDANKELVPNLQALEDRNFFYGELQWYNYTYSKIELARWLRVVGKNGLNKFVTEISINNFYSNYKKVESGNTGDIKPSR
jgi:hypothetical protein